jgi:hypothetical protein
VILAIQMIVIGLMIKTGQPHRLVLMLTEIIFAIAGGHQGDVIQAVMI